jgi:hypothetical protein
MYVQQLVNLFTLTSQPLVEETRIPYMQSQSNSVKTQQHAQQHRHGI